MRACRCCPYSSCHQCWIKTQ